MTKDIAAKTLKNDVLIEEDVVECMPERVPDAIADENVDIFLARRRFTEDAWAVVQDLYKQKVHKMTWSCSVCYHNLSDDQAIICDSCLLRYNFKCCGITRQPKAKTWFCRKCHAKAKQ